MQVRSGIRSKPGAPRFPYARTGRKEYMSHPFVLLDLDDTLLVEEESAYRSFLAAARHLGRRYPIDPEEFVTTVRTCARELWHSMPFYEYAKNIGIASHEALWARFSGESAMEKEMLKHRDRYRIQAWSNALARHDIVDEKLAAELSCLFREERRAKHILFSDAIIFLDRLRDRNVPMALISNGTPDLQREKINACGIERYFRSIVISGEVGCRKPRREIFIYCLERLGCAADEALMIGDRLDTDIRGANDAKITSAWLNREQKENTSGIIPRYEIHSLLDEKLMNAMET